MRLSFIFSQLETSELSQLSCIDQETGKIRSDKRASVVDVINSGLIDLHTRFPLKLGTVDVPIDPAVTQYNLGTFDAKTRTRFLQLQSMKDQHGRELRVNEGSNRSINFLDRLTFDVPRDMQDDYGLKAVSVVYRAMPRLINCCDVGIPDPDIIDVDLDMAYVWALCLFVASRMNQPVGLQEIPTQLTSYVGLYNAECNRLTEVGNAQRYVPDDNAIRRNGWA